MAYGPACGLITNYLCAFMTHTSLLRILGVIAIAMLFAVSSVAFAQTDTYANDGSMQTTNATDGTPGVPNTGAGPDPLTTTLLVLAVVAAAGGAVYLFMAPRDTTLDQV